MKDHNFPAASIDRVVDAAKKVYDLYGEPDRLQLRHPDCDHDFPDAWRREACSLFDRVLLAN